jgi:hypothetical protein
VSPVPPENQGWELDADLGSAIHYVAKLSYRLLDEQRGPQDWMAVFYVLVILVVIDQTMAYPTRHNLATLAPARKALSEVLHNLAHYYYIVSYGGQPLRGQLDNEMPVKCQEKDTPGYRHFGNLNRLGRHTSKKRTPEYIVIAVSDKGTKCHYGHTVTTGLWKGCSGSHTAMNHNLTASPSPKTASCGVSTCVTGILDLISLCRPTDTVYGPRRE